MASVMRRSKRKASALPTIQVGRRLRQRLSGIAAVEMAIVITLLLLLTLGLLEYGWLFMKAQAVTNAARQGARVGILPYSSTADAQAAIDELMSKAGLSESGYTVVFTPSDVGALDPNQTLRVDITVPYANIAIINAPLIPIPATLHAAVSMAKEGA